MSKPTSSTNGPRQNHYEYDNASVGGHSTHSTFGIMSTPDGPPGNEHSYINKAFSFLGSDEYGHKDTVKSNATYLSVTGSGPPPYDSTRSPPYNTTNSPVTSRAGVYTVSNGVTHTNSVSNSDLPKKGGKKIPCCYIVLLVIFILLIIAGAVFAVIYILEIRKESLPNNSTEVPVSTRFEGGLRLDQSWDSRLEDPESTQFTELASKVEHDISLIIEESDYSHDYSVNVYDMSEGSVLVLFRLIFQEARSVSEILEDLQTGYQKLIASGQTDYIINSVDNDIFINMYTTTSPLTRSSASPTTTTPYTGPTFTGIDPTRTTPPTANGSCEYLAEQVCRDQGYSVTGFPNLNGHTNQTYIRYYKLPTYIELAQRGCYDHALMFGCSLLFPGCDEDTLRLKHPCRSFCLELQAHCSSPVPCEMFPNDDDPDLCVLSPDFNKVEPTRTPFASPCEVDEFLCGNDNCVMLSEKCDEVDNCGDFSDEHCGEPSTLDCDFENGNICNWSHDPDGHFHWVLNTGHTTSAQTGPVYDHTTRTSTGQYLLAEASGQYWLDEARLLSQELTLTTAAKCLRFYFHMYGEHVNSLKVYQLYSDGNQIQLWQRRNNHGDTWKYGYVTLPLGIYRVAIVAKRGDSHISDIALDDVTMADGVCPQQECMADEYMCGNGHCILKEYVCDGLDSCGDFSDERDCECHTDEWRCGFGMCIDSYKRCDNYTDCPDGTDELNCICDLGQHQCGSGECIMAEWLCDHETDCKDGSDEMKCPTCADELYQCLDHNCISPEQQCDGSPDCPDHSDEAKCSRLRDDKVVEVYREQNWLPLCSANHLSSYNNDLCRLLGKGAALYHNDVTVASTRYVTWRENTTPGGNVLSQLEMTEACEGNNVVELECADLQCGERSDDLAGSFIVEGNDATAGKWPWHIGLEVNGLLACGGSLVSQNHVITAAHCVEASIASDLKVVVGMLRAIGTDPNRKEIRVKKITVPDEYWKFYQGYDITVLVLQTEVQYNDYIQPICIPHADDIFPLTSTCYVTGWGYTDYWEAIRPDILQEAKMKIWTNEACKEGYNYISDSMICAGYRSGFISSCPGDSGGPLQCLDQHGRWSLVGVFSFLGVGCNIPMHPPVFTRVHHYLDWIDQSMVCAFKCDNGKCLWDSNEICNGVDNCGDFSDELRTCIPSHDCTFEDPYMCGYTYSRGPSVTRWDRRRGGFAVNEGPITDISIGTPDGYLAYAPYMNAFLLAPIYLKPGPHCYTFYYNTRGGGSRALKVFTAPTSGASLPHEVDLSSRTTVKQFPAIGLDIWLYAEVDIPAGDYVIGFEGQVTSGTGTNIGIDDVNLISGQCSELSCSEDQFPCTQDNLCIPLSQRCNYHTYCIDVSDETQCENINRYTCDMEQYASCGLEQDYTDDLDWQVKKPEYGNTNIPINDHTLGNQFGFLLYLNTYGYAGDTGIVKLPIKTPNTQGCLEFYYNMVSSGSLSIYYCDQQNRCELTWRKSNTNEPRWIRTQLLLNTGTSLIQIAGAVGSGSHNDAVSYIALDDLNIENTECTAAECKSKEHRCGDGSCILNELVCDGIVDCQDGSDEVSAKCPCTSDTFQCSNGKCLTSHVRCNGVNNCGDDSDENGCLSQCSDNEYQCADGTCKRISTWCDGVMDCNDGSDEKPFCECLEGQTQCTNGRCILSSKWCDGNSDCLDGSDESPTCTCNPQVQFTCGDGSCILLEHYCDNIIDCSDNSDELNCTCDGFKCNNGICMNSMKQCDGFPDCPMAEDEAANCECGPGRLRCTLGGCINSDYECDARPDCYDGSDEHMGCACYEDETQCDNGLCIYSTYECNGVNNCGDYSDEKDCGPCTVGDFLCSNSLCISDLLRCNGHDDCGDESDEIECACGQNEYQCSDGRCIQQEWVCDGAEDCADGADEDSCGVCNGAAEFTCKNHECIDVMLRCDGNTDCEDGTDELNCFKEGADGVLLGHQAFKVLPVCSANWKQGWSNIVCQQMGHGPAVATNTVSYDNMEYLTVPWNTEDFNMAMFQASTSCTNNEVLAITCELLECGTTPAMDNSLPASFIIGGEVSQEGAWPWTAVLQYRGKYRCGAVLIDDTHALSAAHCFIWPTSGADMSNIPHYFRIIIGSTKQNGGTANAQIVNIASITLHHNYTKSNDGFEFDDIAVLRLANPVAVTNHVRPLCLPNDIVPEPITSSTYCYVSGWGFSNVDIDQAVIDLREAKMVMWSNSRCNADASWNGRMNTQKQTCGGYTSGAISTCFGDSGSPLMCRASHGKWYLAGIVSSGPQNCGESGPSSVPKPSLFTKVSYYLGWIKGGLS